MTGRVRSSVLWTVLISAMLLLAGCRTGAPGASQGSRQASGVRGWALIAGGPAPGTARPVRGVVVVAHSGGPGGSVAGSSTADASGLFKIDLSPGTYTLVQTGTYGEHAPPQVVTVEPGTYATVMMTLQVR